MPKLSKDVLTRTHNSFRIYGHEVRLTGEDRKFVYKMPRSDTFKEAEFIPPFTDDFQVMYEQAKSVPLRIKLIVSGPSGALSLFISRKLRDDVIDTADFSRQATQQGTFEGILLPRICFLNEEYIDVLIRNEDGVGWVDQYGGFHKLERQPIEFLRR